MRFSMILATVAILFMHSSAQSQDSLPPIVPGENLVERQTSEDLAPIRSAAMHRLMQAPQPTPVVEKSRIQMPPRESSSKAVGTSRDRSPERKPSELQRLNRKNRDRSMKSNDARGPRAGLRKDLTISMPGRPGLREMEAKPTKEKSTTPKTNRKYSNKKTARLPFEAEAISADKPKRIKDRTVFPAGPAPASLPVVETPVDETIPTPRSSQAAKVKTVSTKAQTPPAKIESKTQPNTGSDVGRERPVANDSEGVREVPADLSADPIGESRPRPSKVKAVQHVAQSSSVVPGFGMILGDCSCPPDIEFWRPHGYDGVWPPDEYLCDGGDANVRVTVNRDSIVYGLDLEDTVAHYDTADGRTLVTPSNSVCIYAPRFASVRKVIGVQEDDRLLRPGAIDSPVPPIVEEAIQPPLVVEQPLPPLRLLDIDGPLALRDRRREVEIDQTQRVAELVSEFEAYEDFQVVRLGIDSSADKARMIEYIAAAVEWSDNDAPEVLVGSEEAVVDKSVERTGMVYQLKVGPPCLRIIKLADRTAAQPGEIVEFTLRYDNIGEQPVDQVTIMDNLTTRLEFVPGSSQSDRKAEFFSDENQGESLALRWEIKEPLLPGDGGIIRFKCKVR